MTGTTCQAEYCANAQAIKSKRLVKPMTLLAAMAVLLTAGTTAIAGDADVNIPNRLFAGRHSPLRPAYPAAPMPPKDRLITPPGEEPYFPVRSDGQPYVLNVDRTVNLTEAINQFYYDPKWRGEVWTPFDQYTSVERAQRLMATWPEYDEFSQFRKLNHWHKFWERNSGFGP